MSSKDPLGLGGPPSSVWTADWSSPATPPEPSPEPPSRRPEGFDAIWQAWATEDPPPTLQGELLRCAMALLNEAERNGNGNWSSGWRAGDLKFIVDHLGSSEVLNAFEQASVVDLSEKIFKLAPTGRGTNNLLDWGSYDTLLGFVTTFVQRAPTPIDNPRSDGAG